MNATTICPDGKYSLPGSDDPGDCNCPNSSSSRQNAKYVTECICDSGYYKEYSGLYPLGGWYCRLCQVGEFCFNNTNRTCPAFSTSFGVAKSFSDCFCNPGYQNATIRTEEAFCENCPANYYCTGKGSVEACTTNAISPTQSQDQTRCFCDLGYRGLNNTPCVACQSPTFCYGGVQAQCSEGTFSPALAWDRLNCSCIPGRWGPAGGPCILCGAGKYNLYPGCKACSNTSDLDCELCALGTASTSLGRDTTCDVCGAGTYSFPANTRGAQTCEPCGNGFAAPAGSSNCTACLAGQYAAAGFSACVACPAGTYSPLRASSCTSCPANSWSSLQQSKCTANTGFYDVDTSLRAYYPFNADNFLADITGVTGNLVASTNSPTQQASGPFGAGSYSAYLDASGSTVLSATSQFFSLPSLLLPNAMSICTWFWMSPSITTAYTYILDFGIFGILRNIQIFTQNNNLRTGMFVDNTIGLITLTNEARTTQVWRHLCLAVSDSSAVFWLDGVPNPFNMTRNRDFTRLLTSNFIGRSNFNGQSVWWGALDEVRIYHKALSATELAALYAFRGDTTSPMIILTCPNPCAAGTYGGCLGDGTQNCSSCAAGLYSSGTGQTSVSTCQSCVIGTFSLSGASSCSGCLAGTYGTGLRFTSSGLCTACASGTYGTGLGYTNQGSCTFCQPGAYQTGVGMSNCLLCQSGTYSTNSGASAGSTCQLCIAGKFGTMQGSPKADNCDPCEWGTFSTLLGAPSSSNCSLCIAGTYSSFSGSSSSNSCLSCQPGRYSSSQGAYSSSACQACIAGTFASSAGTTRCPPCPEGSFTPVNASTNCSFCGLGVYSYAGMSSCLACQAGKYKEYEGCFFCSNSTDDDCQACFPGSASNILARQTRCDWCEPGYFASTSGLQTCSPCGNGSIALGAAQACFSCPLGNFAPIGSSACTPCPPDTYLDVPYQGSITSCKQCPAGKVSPYTGAQTVLACTACFPGKYKVLEECQLCETGKYTSIAGATTCSACSNGTISGSGSSTCLTCLLGTYAPAGTGVCLDCPFHTYLDYPYAGSVSECKPCPPGTWSWMFATPSLQMCYPCQPGTYELNRNCLDCAAGSFSGLQATACLACPTGKYSGIGAGDCTLCPAGSFSDRSNTSSCLLCQAGTFSQPGQAACQPCPIAEYSPSPNASSCQSCPAGSYSDQTGGTNCTECGPGTFSTGNASACLLCPYGSFHNETEQSECQPCRNGTFAPAGSLEVSNQIMLWSRF